MTFLLSRIKARFSGERRATGGRWGDLSRVGGPVTRGEVEGRAGRRVDGVGVVRVRLVVLRVRRVVERL